MKLELWYVSDEITVIPGADLSLDHEIQMCDAAGVMHKRVNIGK